MQALILAAGMGRRLGKYTKENTKCMVSVAGKTLLERTVDALKEADIHKLIMVVGYKGENVKAFVRNHITDMQVEFIDNPIYATSNNIYSLFIAKDRLLEDDTILIESDLIYDVSLLRRLKEDPRENLAVVAKYQHWMDGTVALIDSDGQITEFIEKKNFDYDKIDRYYKTVNIYKFSKAFSKQQYIPFLTAYMHAYGTDQYYEAALRVIAYLKNSGLRAFDIANLPWYEIDDGQDLEIAESLFTTSGDRLNRYQGYFGGYWRFSEMKDFCYLVNPYFPPKPMLDKMKDFFPTLLAQYPSGMKVQQLLAERMFSVDGTMTLIGNGAAELINCLGSLLKGKMAVHIPAFNEYRRCFRDCEIITLDSHAMDFTLSLPALLNAAESCDIVTVISPDNPSGSMLSEADMTTLLDKCAACDTRLIVDESFIDFAAPERRYTLLQDSILRKYPNLVVMKSVSKSYGVPGLRLGVMATADETLLSQVKEMLPVWNINSFAEYFMQIISLFQSTYVNACNKIAQERTRFVGELRQLGWMHVYDSEANFVLCRLTGRMNSKELTERLLSEHQILIKDLASKDGFAGESFIRIAVKDQHDDDMLLDALRTLNKEAQ